MSPRSNHYSSFIKKPALPASADTGYPGRRMTLGSKVTWSCSSGTACPTSRSTRPQKLSGKYGNVIGHNATPPRKLGSRSKKRSRSFGTLDGNGMATSPQEPPAPAGKTQRFGTADFPDLRRLVFVERESVSNARSSSFRLIFKPSSSRQHPRASAQERFARDDFTACRITSFRIRASSGAPRRLTFSCRQPICANLRNLRF